MNSNSSPLANPLADNTKLYRRLQLNFTRNRLQDQSEQLDQMAAQFSYAECRDQYWTPEEFSLLYGTPLWEQSSSDQRLILNHLYWVAYFSQIISAEIATILFNQTSAAGLFALEEFRLICDMLDLESAQERAHIYAFRAVIKQVEEELFGERLFSYAMRGPFTETIIFADTDALRTFWKKLQLHAFGLISADNAFLACQYFTVRGLRTLNGKLIQHQLSLFHQRYPEPDRIPIPTRIAHHHFLDESFHFNSSTLIGQEVISCLRPPSPWERWVANLGIRGCQQDHYHFSVAVNGIFWFDPALYGVIYKLLCSPHFNLPEAEAKQMLWSCFGEETEGLHRSFATHRQAMQSYKCYLDPLDYIWSSNRHMTVMASQSLDTYLTCQRRALSHGWN